MNSFRCGKLRLLYLLALAQLVGGPLVLLQVTFFCKTVAQELPRRELSSALVEAWDSSCAVTEGVAVANDPQQQPLSRQKKDPTKWTKVKQPVLPWEFRRFQPAIQSVVMCGVLYEKAWTPVWPQAPPGPPPRVG